MRVDQLLVYLRFAKSRSSAQAMANSGHMRCNGGRITRASARIMVGDVLVFPHGKAVKTIRLIALPKRRGSSQEAQSCYDMLDASGQSALAAPQNCL